MMRFIRIIFLLLICASCNDAKKESKETAIMSNVIVDDTTGNFFPVTTYIKGEIFSIKEDGINPLKKIIIAGKTDSSFLKIEDLEIHFAEFLKPIIDTNNLKKKFTEKKFLDQTLNAFTFTYDQRDPSDSFAFKHWDVYVDPETGNVKRIYLVKQKDKNTSMQLTWLSRKYCSMVTITEIDGKSSIIKEEKISWSY